MEEEYEMLLKKFEEEKNYLEKNNIYNIDKLYIIVKKILKYGCDKIEKSKLQLNNITE